MSDRLPFEHEDLGLPSISPLREMGAYEALWSNEGMSFRKIARMRGGSSEPALSDFVDESVACEFAERARNLIKNELIYLKPQDKKIERRKE